MWIDIAIVAVIFWFPLAFAASAVRADAGAGGSIWVLRDRVEVFTGAADCVAVLAVGRVLGPWDVVPPAIWGLALAIAIFALVLGARTWPALPSVRLGSRPATRWTYLAIEIVIVSLVLFLVI